ncbi:enoyl-CoA hydratase/isomerase family protein [Azospirillum sp. YIM B02556]|uniref:Enoyl-CoA hydratase/isomerase family protein n=1 Tax=Azospirillum endophyticum TaxID=2800326 RepID=A0ABS1F4T8_9PROT|nr:enoyl-CoA hydratase-related protein [Azospirillum endophyticum]MBK1838434.1 enoyl-CoA hydratase/isomerase family protein [Azospirillum endophyticum]
MNDDDGETGGTVRLERRGAVAILTLDAPKTRNAVTDPPVLEPLLAALAAVAADRSLRVLVVTGAGKAFSAGGNIHDIRDRRGMFGGPADQVRNAYRAGVQRIPRAMAELEIPVIAAVNGAAYGAGCDLVFMCDLRIAGESARISSNFVKLGLISGDGGLWFLTRVAGPAVAAEMAFTGRAVGGAEAAALGLVSRVVPDAELMPMALALAEEIAANPPEAVRMTKRMLQQAGRVDLSTMLDMAAALQGICHAGEESRLAIEAATKPVS